MFSSELKELFDCKFWLWNLSLYLLMVIRGGEDGDALNETVASQDFFLEDSKTSNTCVYLIEHSAEQLRHGPHYITSFVYKEYLMNNGKGRLSYKQALDLLDAEYQRVSCPFNETAYQLQKDFINALHEFRSATAHFLRDKKKPKDEELSPIEVLRLISKYFAYEVAFCLPKL